MLHYASGPPANDEFQAVENQLARQRLFSVHPNYVKPLARWLDDIRQGIFSFDDRIQVGFKSDFAAIPQPQRLVDAFDHEIFELMRTTQR